MHIHTSGTDTNSNVTMTAGASIGSNWESAKFLMAGDFNADGKPDRLDVFSGQLRYSQGNGNGTFGAPVVIDPSTACGTMRLVD
ncbi:FG-GAP repeat domain-containing protein [Streptomyces sp. NBC_01190]|uniref:FG-GAP repeat domain-containing protein n=1 Tax=Streptomyces sp. NBC_01190 TaxID=2903767 RepID=UPI0038671DE6|nr:VCBS repeat-containing protein [Streptomyces sp. NBC_01190]